MDAARAWYVESLASFHAVGNPLGTTEAIERFGLLAAVMGRALQAARLFGYGAARRATMGAPVPPVERDEQARIQGALQEALGAEGFDAAWEAGQLMSLDEAIADARAGPASSLRAASQE